MKYLISTIFFFGLSACVLAQSSESVAGARKILTLNLPTALKLADERNSSLAIGIEKVYQAELTRNEAWHQWLPTLRAGIGYAFQDGNLQNTDGDASEVTRNSRSGGLGVARTGSGVPAYPGVSMEINIADAIYAPQIANENLRASAAERDEVRFLRTLDVINAYYNLVLAQQAIQLERQALAEAEALAMTTEEFAAAGQGLQADADRAAVEQLLQRHNLESALIRREAASAELKRILNLRDMIHIRSAERTVVPLSLYDKSSDPDSAVMQALDNRTAIDAIEYRLEAKRLEINHEANGAFIPKIGASYSYGAFGAGRDFDGGTGGSRHDVTVALYWELNSMGFVNRSKARRRESEHRALRLRLEQARTDISTEIRMTLSELEAIARQLKFLRDGVRRARNGYKLSRERIFENQGLPLEALSAFESLTKMEMLYAQTAARYNKAQLFLLKSTGSPIIGTAGIPDKKSSD